jgi:hypothetical protein
MESTPPGDLPDNVVPIRAQVEIAIGCANAKRLRGYFSGLFVEYGQLLITELDSYE